MPKQWLGVVLGVVLGLAAAPLAGRAWWLSHWRAEIVSAEVIKANDRSPAASDLNRWLASKSLRIRAKAHNDSWLPFRLDGGSYEVYVSSVRAASGDWPLDLGLGGPVEITALIPLKDPAVRAVLLNPTEEGIHVEVRGKLRLRVLGIAWHTPLMQRFRVKPVFKF